MNFFVKIFARKNASATQIKLHVAQFMSDNCLISLHGYLPPWLFAV